VKKLIRIETGEHGKERGPGYYSLCLKWTDDSNQSGTAGYAESFFPGEDLERTAAKLRRIAESLDAIAARASLNTGPEQ
jgi:hypothetical protein